MAPPRSEKISVISVISVNEVTKLFGAQRALRKVSLEAKSGDCVGIVGANGAGKSTLLSILAMQMKPTAGTLKLNGHSPDAEMRAAIGVLSHQPLVYPALSCKENLEMYAQLCGVDEKRVDYLKNFLELSDFFSDRPAGVLSRGQLQRLSLARALIASPDVLLLDEPSSGLDRKSTALIEQLVADHRNAGGIAFLVSHDPQLVAAVSTRIILFELGELKRETESQDAAEVAALLEGKLP